MRAYAGRQFAPFLWWSLVWPGRETNSRPTVREADTLPTEPNQHGQLYNWCKYPIINDHQFLILVIYCFPQRQYQVYIKKEYAYNLHCWFILLHLFCLWINYMCIYTCMYSVLKRLYYNQYVTIHKFLIRYEHIFNLTINFFLICQ